jgi:hypothetical protein
MWLLLQKASLSLLSLNPHWSRSPSRKRVSCAHSHCEWVWLGMFIWFGVCVCMWDPLLRPFKNISLSKMWALRLCCWADGPFHRDLQLCWCGLADVASSFAPSFMCFPCGKAQETLSRERLPRGWGYKCELTFAWKPIDLDPSHLMH